MSHITVNNLTMLITIGCYEYRQFPTMNLNKKLTFEHFPRQFYL